MLRDDQIEMLHERRTVGFSEGVGDMERGDGAYHQCAMQ